MRKEQNIKSKIRKLNFQKIDEKYFTKYMNENKTNQNWS